MSKSMSNKSPAVWLVAGGPMQRLAAEKIRERGYATIVSDGSSECALRPLADKFLQLDTFDIEGHIRAADEICARYDVRAVFTAGADCHETVARLAQHLCLPGIDPEISHLCRFKDETRKVLTKAGVPQPALSVARTYEEGVIAARNIGYPVALKATDNSGSRGFSRIGTEKDFSETAFARALENGTTGSVIVEELLVPEPGVIAEQSVETVWYDGHMRWLNWVDRLFRKDFAFVSHPWTAKDDPYHSTSWAIELAHFNPAEHKETLRAEIESLILSAGKAIGMHTQKGGHILKADIMLTTKGPIILELTPRLSGGWDSALSTPTRGADFIGGALGLALGEQLDDAYFERYFRFAQPEKVVAVMSKIKEEAEDCVGRSFAWGSGANRAEALGAAYKAFLEENFLT